MALSKLLERFDDFDSDEIENMVANLQNKNTTKSDKKCEKILSSYLVQLGRNLSFGCVMNLNWIRL